jgi:hypothetical protein
MLVAMRRTLALAAAATLILAACGGDKKKEAAPEPTTTTAAAAPAPTGDVSPLTGLPWGDNPNKGRPILIVKVDNAPKARPQAGMIAADFVISEKVEDGVTRMLVMYQSQDADPVGPVRSARSTDILLVGSLNRPLFAYSGANKIFAERVRSAPLVDLSADHTRGPFFRLPGRPQPYHLFTKTADLFGRAPEGSGPPGPQFTWRADGQPSAGEPAGALHIEYRGDKITTIVDYAWDAGAGAFLRSVDRGPHKDNNGEQVRPKNVIVQFTEYVNTGLFDASGAPVPEGKVIGEGEAWVLTDGKVVKGRWQKPDEGAVTKYVDGAGKEIPLTPGQTWVELAPVGSSRLG